MQRDCITCATPPPSRGAPAWRLHDDQMSSAIGVMLCKNRLMPANAVPASNLFLLLSLVESPAKEPATRGEEEVILSSTPSPSPFLWGPFRFVGPRMRKVLLLAFVPVGLWV